MPAYTQSGYSVLPTAGSTVNRNAQVDGVTFPGGIRKGDVETVLLYVAHRWHTEIEPLVRGWCWGFAAKQITGGTGWSNHSGAAAIDINAPRHPQHRYTLTALQIHTARRIRDACGGVVRWGGDWTPSSIDQMHWEIAPGMAGRRVAALAAKIRRGSTPVKPSITKSGLTVARAQTLLNRTGVGAPLEVDGAYGPKTASTVERFQHAHHLPVTGTINDATWNVLRQWSTKYVQEPASVRQTAIERMHEIQGQLGLSTAAVAHLETAYQNIAKATSDPALKTALARYRELLDGVDVGASAFQHLRTAIKNVEKTM